MSFYGLVGLEYQKVDGKIEGHVKGGRSGTSPGNK